MSRNESAAALAGPIASVSQPKIGRPPPLNRAKNDTRPAAVAGSSLMISWPTLLEMPMAISPLSDPMMKQSHRPKLADVRSISETEKLRSPAAAAAPCQPSGPPARRREPE